MKPRVLLEPPIILDAGTRSYFELKPEKADTMGKQKHAVCDSVLHL